MSTTKLEKLLMEEVSGVDAPANLLPGWMVTKAATPDVSFGPDTATWDVGAAELRIREATGATTGPNAAYSSCYLYKNETADPSFGDFKFLVSDVVDGEIAVMPAALRAAEQRLDSSSIPEDAKVEVAATIKALQERMVEPVAPEEDATSIVGKIKRLLLGKEIDMTKDELSAELDARFEAFGDSLAEKLSKSVEAAPAGEVPAATESDPAVGDVTDEAAPAVEPAVTAEDITKAVEDALQPVLEILDKTLDRLETLERGGVARKSVEGQEDALDVGEPVDTNTVKHAIAKAFGHGAAA